MKAPPLGSLPPSAKMLLPGESKTPCFQCESAASVVCLIHDAACQDLSCFEKKFSCETIIPLILILRSSSISNL